VTERILNAGGEVDLLLCSPDGEPRGVLARAGDIFPLSPSGDLGADISGDGPEGLSPSRPWGLRFLRVAQPRAGKHVGTPEATTEPPGGDTKNPEDWTKD
jgi:hypothetical protein